MVGAGKGCMVQQPAVGSKPAPKQERERLRVAGSPVVAARN